MADKNQLSLFGTKSKPASRSPIVDRFDGDTYDSSKDGRRLTTLMGRVYKTMIDGKWRTLAQIASACNGSEASVSARLRDLRKVKFKKRYPNFDVERRRVADANGLHEYRVRK